MEFLCLLGVHGAKKGYEPCLQDSLMQHSFIFGILVFFIVIDWKNDINLHADLFLSIFDQTQFRL